MIGSHLSVASVSASASSAWSQVIPTIAAAVLGLVGVAVGAWLGSKGLRDQWLRSERLKIYSQLVVISQRMIQIYVADLPAGREKSLEAASATTDRLADQWASAEETTASILLIGGKDTYDAAEAIMKTLTQILKEAVRTTESIAVGNVEETCVRSAKEAIKRFTQAARNDIDVGHKTERA
jgi:hypothetical protein